MSARSAVGATVAAVVFLGLLTPFNVSNNPLTRLFTNDKVAAYFAVVVIGTHVSNHGLSVIRRLPGLWIWAALLASMAASTALAPDVPTALAQFGREITYMAFALAQVLVFRNVRALRLFWTIVVYAVCVLALLAVTGYDMSGILGSTDRARTIEETVISQSMFEAHVEGQASRRATVLWLDANNLGYLILPALLYLVLVLTVESHSPKATLLRTALLVLLVYGLIETSSRGAMVATTSGLVLLLLLLRRSTKHAGRRLGPLTLLLVVGGVGAGAWGAPEGSALMSRFSSFTDSVAMIWAMGGNVTSVSGIETSRLVTSQLAIEDIAERPVLGWGGAKRIGEYADTANHLGYLNILGHYGIVGFLLNMAMLVVLARCLRDALRISRANRRQNVPLGYWLVALLVAQLVSGFFRTITIDGLIPWVFGYYLVALRSREADGGLASIGLRTSAERFRGDGKLRAGQIVARGI